MKQNKVKSTIGIILIGLMSVAILAGSYLLVYTPVRINLPVQLTNQQSTAKASTLLISAKKTQSNNPVSATNNKLPMYDAKSLKTYDGKNGQPAYIAIDGVVYEVGPFVNWVGGFHHGYQAGNDLTKAFAGSPHTNSILSRAKIVGYYSNSPIQSNQNVTSKTTVTPSVQADQKVTNKKATVNKTQNKPKTSNKGLPAMTLKTLSKYNGKNGKPAYVAVNGVIYDVTDYWKNGQHQGLKAGSDVTKAFANSPHSKSLLNRLTIVGSLTSGKKASVTVNNTLTSNSNNYAYKNSNSDKYNDGDDDKGGDDGDYDD